MRPVRQHILGFCRAPGALRTHGLACLPSLLDMETIYDSDRFIVVHMLCNSADDDASEPPQDAAAAVATLRHSFEIVDKQAGTQLYLDGMWSELFQQRIAEWHINVPTQQEVEDTLAGFAGLAQTPLTLH